MTRTPLAPCINSSYSSICVEFVLYSFLSIQAPGCVSITLTSSLYTTLKFSDNSLYRDINPAALLSQLMDDVMTEKWWCIDKAIDKQRWSGWEIRVHMSWLGYKSDCAFIGSPLLQAVFVSEISNISGVAGLPAGSETKLCNIWRNPCRLIILCFFVKQKDKSCCDFTTRRNDFTPCTWCFIHHY